jgi:hypothetical protein
MLALEEEFSNAARIMPKLGLKYNPKPWNHPDIVSKHNCFDYALDELKLGFAWPGRLVNKELTIGRNGPTPSERLLQDGFMRIHQHSLDPLQYHIFAFDGYQDHFIRLDGNGIWSHKLGSYPATNRDQSGKVILDPYNSQLYSRQDRIPEWEYYTIPSTGVPFIPDFF